MSENELELYAIFRVGTQVTTIDFNVKAQGLLYLLCI